MDASEGGHNDDIRKDLNAPQDSLPAQEECNHHTGSTNDDVDVDVEVARSDALAPDTSVIANLEGDKNIASFYRLPNGQVITSKNTLQSHHYTQISSNPNVHSSNHAHRGSDNLDTAAVTAADAAAPANPDMAPILVHAYHAFPSSSNTILATAAVENEAVHNHTTGTGNHDSYPDNGEVGNQIKNQAPTAAQRSRRECNTITIVAIVAVTVALLLIAVAVLVTLYVTNDNNDTAIMIAAAKTLAPLPSPQQPQQSPSIRPTVKAATATPPVSSRPAVWSSSTLPTTRPTFSSTPNLATLPPTPMATFPPTPLETFPPTPFVVAETFGPTPLVTAETYAPTPLVVAETFAPTPLPETFAPTPLPETFAPYPLPETFPPTPQ